MATFNVLEKDLDTDIVRAANITFFTLEEATEWAENMMSIWEDFKAYKIVEVD